MLPKPSSTAKTLRDNLVHSKLKLTDYAEWGNFPCGRGNCEICNILKPGKDFKSTITEEIYRINFHFDFNSMFCLLDYK